MVFEYASTDFAIPNPLKLVSDNKEMADLADAFIPSKAANTEYERPLCPPTGSSKAREELPEFVQHVKERRHILGLVGGNEVSRAAANLTDVESDLLGITRPFTRSEQEKHLPSTDPMIVRKNLKNTIRIDTTPVHLRTYQMMAYPAVVGPEPLQKETCHRPEKY